MTKPVNQIKALNLMKSKIITGCTYDELCDVLETFKKGERIKIAIIKQRLAENKERVAKNKEKATKIKEKIAKNKERIAKDKKEEIKQITTIITKYIGISNLVLEDKIQETKKEKLPEHLCDDKKRNSSNDFLALEDKVQEIKEKPSITIPKDKHPYLLSNTYKEDETFQFLKNNVFDHAYFVNAKNTDSIPRLKSFITKYFNNCVGTTNKEFYKEIIGLNLEQIKKLFILADITDNNSNLLPALNKTLKEKISSHLKIYMDIVTKASLNDAQNLIYQYWLKDLGWEEILNKLHFIPEYKEKKQRFVIGNFTSLVHKIRFAAIKQYQKYFEAGLDKEKMSQIKTEMINLYHKKTPWMIHDRYFRIKLGFLLKEFINNYKVDEKNIAFAEFPKYIKKKKVRKLRDIASKFGIKLGELFEFAMPEAFNKDDFEYIGRWCGDDAKLRAFLTIERKLTNEQEYLFTKEIANKYGLTGMVIEILNKKNYSLLNKLYVNQYLREKLLLESNEEFAKFSFNRKFLILLSQLNSNLPEEWKYISEKNIVNINSLSLISSLKKIEQKIWMSVIKTWDYKSLIERAKTAQALGISKKEVYNVINRTRKQLINKIIKY